MSAQSKLIDTAINCSCHEYVHPWTSSCVCAATGLMLSCIPFSLRTYTVVYLASTLSLAALKTHDIHTRLLACEWVFLVGRGFPEYIVYTIDKITPLQGELIQ